MSKISSINYMKANERKIEIKNKQGDVLFTKTPFFIHIGIAKNNNSLQKNDK